MQYSHKRKTETHFERSTQEETLVGSSRVQRHVNERRGTSETVDERVEVDDEWASVHRGSRHPSADGPSIQADRRKQLGSG